MTPIRGLNERITYAQAELYRRIALNPPMSFQDTVTNPALRRAAASRSAKKLGYDECTQEVLPPIMFRDVPELLEAWHAGYAHRIDTLEGWRAHCEELWQAANQSCRGGGYEWFQETFSCAVNFSLAKRVPYALHDQALRAIADLDYVSPEQRKARAEREDDGFCCHGIERYYCPAGCGEHDLTNAD